MRVGIRVDGRKTEQAFKEARKDINDRMKTALRLSAERVALPKIRTLAPSVVRSVLVARATKTRAYITTQGKRENDRITGLLNFGGLVTTRIYPVKKRALKIGSTGEVRAAVTRPRRYRGKGFIQRGLIGAIDGIERTHLEEIEKAFAGFK